MSFSHQTVLLRETVAAVEPRDGGLYADLTLGGGGHAEAILEACGPTGRLVGVDRDEDALKAAGERLSRFGDRAILVHGTFGGFAQRAVREDWGYFDGVIADVGVSSHQIDTADRGFSFRHEGPLDMRMDPSDGLSAKELIASLDAEGLANLIYEFGEERRSRPSPARSSAPKKKTRFTRRRTSPAPFGVSSAVDTAASIQRRARFRRCASPSTTNSVSWTSSWTKSPTC